MSSQSSTLHTPNNNSDLALYGSPVQLRQNKNIPRRTSSFVKMATEDHHEENHQRQARLTRSDARRGSSFIRAMSEDLNEDNKYSGKSLKPDIRPGASFFIEDTHEEHLSTPQSSKDIRRGSSFIKTADDSLEDGSSGRRFNVRRGSSFIRMISEDINSEEMHSTGRLSSKPESRRGSGISKVMSEDSSEDTSRRSSRADMRRGSSFVRLISEENEDDESQISGNSTDRSDFSDKLRKSLDNTYRHSLESISEYKSHKFSSASEFSNIEYTMPVESTSDFSSDFAIKTSNENTDDNTEQMFVNSSLSYLSWIESVNSLNSDHTTAPVIDNDNRFGEWNSFWTNYNSSRNEYFSSPYLCPSNSGEDLSLDSNASTQRGYIDKSATDNIFLTADEVNEALRCTQRLTDILRGAIKRSGVDEGQKNLSKEEQKSNEENAQKEKSMFKSNSCIDVLLNHTGMADILKRVINKRRDIIMPPDEASTPKSSLSEWSISKK